MLRRLTLAKPWEPKPYQERAVSALKRNSSMGLLLSPGLGKTAITLKAISDMIESGEARSAIVIAPLRVCASTWPHEIAKWKQFKHLSYSIVTGSPKARLEALRTKADIYLINPEQVAWMVRTPEFGRMAKDILVIDELTKFKTWTAQRTKALRPWLPAFKYRWGLTGSFSANGLEGVFSQTYCLDVGKTFGQYITHYRHAYFTQGRFASQWTLKPGAEQSIYRKLAPITLQMSAEDYLDMPQMIINPIMVDLPDKVARLYKQMLDDLIGVLETGTTIVSPSAAGALAKCRQIASGAVYYQDTNPLLKMQPKKWEVLHDEKLKALEELVEELQGSPLFVAYMFEHDRERILQHIPGSVDLGKATDPAGLIAQWNRGAIPVMLGHPQSIGHGLNLQESCNNVCWFSLTYDYEIYDQFNCRVYRQGNQNKQVFIHHILARKTEDVRMSRILSKKKKFSEVVATALKDLQQLRSEL